MKRRIYTLSTLLLLPVLAGAQIVITEIMYNPPESGNDSLEFIELYNIGDAAVNLEGYYFENGVTHEFSSTVIESKGYLVLSVNAQALQNVLGVSSVQWMSGALSNGGELITLNDDMGNIVDEVNYSDGGDWPGEADGLGTSLELCDPSADNNDPAEWQASTYGTGVILNGSEIFASPGMDNCILPPDVTIEVRNNVFDPPDITIFVGETVEWDCIEGTHNVNGSLAAYPFNPEGFMSGPAAPAPWTYTYTFTEPGMYNYHCDPHLAMGMTGTITVQSLDQLYPGYAIEEVKGVDANGEADSVGVMCTLEGVVHSINFNPSGYSFALIDETGEGITVFEFSPVSGYEDVTMGDELSIRGRVDQFNGLIQFRPDEVELLSTGNGLVDPEVVTQDLGEAHESHLVQIRNVELDNPSQWEGDGGSFNVDVSNTNGSYVIRVDSDSEISTMPAPEGKFHLTGIGQQYDIEAPYFEGYQIFPRIVEDIEEATAVFQAQLPEIDLFPNPVEEYIMLKHTGGTARSYRIFGMDGALISGGSLHGTHRIQVGSLHKGVYMMLLQTEEALYRATFIKK